VAIHYDPNRDAQIALTGTGNTGTSVADPDPGSGAFLTPGSGAFLTPGSGMGTKSRSGSGIRIRDEHPGEYFRELRNSFLVKNTLMQIRIRDSESFWPWIRAGKIRIRDKHPGAAALTCTEYRC
jgi:hypothetical protein